MARPSNRQRKLSFETLERREVMSGNGLIERPGYALPIHASLEGASLVIEGKDNLNDVVNWRYVMGSSVTFKKQDGTPLLNKTTEYLEISHEAKGPGGNPLRQAWVVASKVKDYVVFHGGGGNDKFEYKITQQKDPWDKYKVDVIAYGGAGNDELHGHNGKDLLFGDDGVDYLRGHLGDDLLHGGRDNDTLVGDAPPRKLPKGSREDADYLVGGPGLDKLYGWQGDDLLNGGNYSEIADGVVDWLYGYDGADCYFIESDSEAKGFSENQGDKKQREWDLRKAPDYADWVLKHHAGLNADWKKTEASNLLASGQFPKLASGDFQVIGPSSTSYNCHAVAMGVYDRTFPKDAFVNSAPRKEWFDLLYKQYGYEPHSSSSWALEAGLEKVVVFTKAGQITHSARQLADGTWLSKIGGYALIRHQDLLDVADGAYGTPTYVYSRPRSDCGCNG